MVLPTVINPSDTGHSDHHEIIHALMITGESVEIKTKNGVPADGDFTSTPGEGTLAYNTATNIMYTRVSGAWVASSGGGSGGVTPVGTNYVLYKTGSTYYAHNMTTQAVEFSGADAATIVQSCISALGVAGGTIDFRPGATYAWSSVPKLPHSLNEWLYIRGNGATIVLSSSGPRFFDFNRTAANQNFRKYCISDFNVDGSSIIGMSGNHHIILGNMVAGDTSTGVQINCADITIEKIRTYNMRADQGIDSNRRENIWIVCHQTAAGQPENRLERLRFTDLTFDGGSMGVVIAGAKAGGWSGQPVIWIDDVVVERLHHDLRVLPTQFAYSSHVHIGSEAYGGTCVIRDLWGYGSKDVGIEINAMENAVIDGAWIKDCHGFYFVHTNYNNPPRGEEQTIKIDNFTGVRSGGEASDWASGLIAVLESNGIPTGKVSAFNCMFFRNTTRAIHDVVTEGELVVVKGRGRGFYGYHMEYNAELFTVSGEEYPTAVYIQDGAFGQGAQPVHFHDLIVRVTGTYTGSAPFVFDAVAAHGDYNLEIDGYRFLCNISGGTPTNAINAVKVGLITGSRLRHGLLKGLVWLGSTGATNPKGIHFNGTGTLTVDHDFVVRDCDFTGMPTAGLEVFFADATNKTKVKTPDNLWVGYPTRPAATNVMAGTQWWNTGTGIPNWSNGTVWKDAAGNNV